MREILRRISTSLLIVLVASGAVQLYFASTYAQAQPPLFSVTILNPTGFNLPVMREFLSIIASNMASLGIDAKLADVTSDEWISKGSFWNSTQGATFSKGGYDIQPDIETGAGSGFVVPDFKFYFDGRPPNPAPTGTNLALYNSSSVTSLFDQLDASTDIQTKIALVHKLQQLVFDDSPYAFIYEPLQIVPRNQRWTAWGGRNVYSVPLFPDIQHYSGGTNLTLAVTYPFYYHLFGRSPGNLNPALTVPWYTPSRVDSDFLVAIDGSGAGLIDQDSRDLSYYPALATNITSSPDGLDWTVQFRKGVLWQSGVEVTADDFVWTRWAFLNPKTASTSQVYDITNLGNVVSFTFLNGTSVTIDNRASSNDAVRYSWFKAVDKYTFQFHLFKPYAFAREVYAGFAPLPKHIMEKFSPETWDNQPFSTAERPYTYTWDTSKYGGLGSYTALGPVGDGPYYLQSYNFTNNVAVLKKFPQYWNATGLEALNEFTVDTYKIIVIADKQSALDALRSGQVDMVQTQGTAFYGFTGSDITTLQTTGVNVILAPDTLWYDLVFNMWHPVLGTGVDTPLGKSNPALAAEAARHVRKAISHLIPRDRIVTELLGGAGVPLAVLGPGWGIWNNNDLKPDSYDNNTAAAELRAAGYTVGGISTLAPSESTPFWLIGGAIVAVVGLTSSMVVVVRKRKKRGPVTAKQMVSTGYADLEGLLHGGIPVGYAVLLISPPCDERDLLLRRMLRSNLSSGMQVFYISGNIARSQELVRSSPKGLFAFCPEANRVVSAEQNLYEIPGIGNLVEFNILLNKGLSERAGEGKSKVIVMDLLSDLLFRHKALMTRKWLGEFIAKRKAQQFTIICTLNPAVTSKEEIGQIADLFDGIIEIFEKESEGRPKTFLAIRKMYGQDYSESEVLLERSKLI